jgi:hypothetical protein
MFTVSIASADGISVVSRPGPMVVVDALDLTLFASRDWPLTLLDRLSWALKKSECGRCIFSAPGTDHQHPLEVAIEGQRRFRQVNALDDAAGVGAVGLQERALADDRHRLFDGADLQPEVDAKRRIDRNDDTVTHGLLEAGQFPGDAVGAVLQVREHVIARFVGDRRIRDVGVHLGDGHRDARQRES